MMLEQRKTGPVRGCVIPILSLIGFLILCFLFCEAVFLLGHVETGTTTTETGGMLIPFIF
jgi:hypothetical protein